MPNYDDIETFFDHNPTKDEIYGFTGSFDMTKEEYLDIIFKICNNDEEAVRISCYGNIYRLYYYRNEKEKALEYADLVPDSDWKIFTLMNHDFEPSSLILPTKKIKKPKRTKKSRRNKHRR